ncbi:MAG: hypothetical protein E7052_01670 [Lentisphaerae bacterium]|nr:hypothetical protein [Lentisphaerota bacterium]
MSKIFILLLYLIFALQPQFCSGSDYKTILGGKDKNVEEGLIFSNKYAQMAFLNSSIHSGSITGGDFGIMPRSDVNGKHTLDESEARIRMFLRPDVRVRTAMRRPTAIHGEADWLLQKAPQGVKYSRKYKRDSYEVNAFLQVVMDPVNARIDFETVLHNSGKRACLVDFTPEFTFLRNGVEPLQLELRREIIRYVDGVRKNFLNNETTIMDPKNRNSWWWRRVARDYKGFKNYFNREIIPFTHPRLIPPDMFGFTELLGNTTLIWVPDKASSMNQLTVEWEAEHGSAAPLWTYKLEPGEKKTVKFRMLTVKGLRHFDEVGDRWVFGYHAEGDLLSVLAVPLAPHDRLSLTTTVSDSHNQVLINQRSEIAAMTPYAPGKVDLRASTPFQINAVYPIKLLLSSLEDNSRILEAAGNIVP